MAMPLRKTQEDTSAQDDFVMILPEITRLVRWCFRYAPAEQREELVAEAVAQGWAMYVSAHRKGKKVTAHAIAWFGWLAARSGRRLCWESKRSVKKWTSIETLGLDELLACDLKGRWPVADQAAFQIDWNEFSGRCTAQEAKAMTLLATGHRRSEVADLLGVSPAWMTTHMKQTHRSWEDFIDTPARCRTSGE